MRHGTFRCRFNFIWRKGHRPESDVLEEAGKLIEVRFHGRGGQGVVLASTVLAQAAFLSGRYAQSFPMFAGERRGAPVKAFTRVGDLREAVRCQVYEPDYVVALDSSVAGEENIFAGIKPGALAIVNRRRDVTEEELCSPGARIVLFNGNRLARAHGLVANGIPIVNMVILGAFLGATGLFDLEFLLEAIDRHLPPSHCASNAKAAEDAYNSVRKGYGE